MRENVTLGLAYRYKSLLLGEFLDLRSSRAMRRRAEDEANQLLKSSGLSEVADLPALNFLMACRSQWSLRAHSLATQSCCYLTSLRQA